MLFAKGQIGAVIENSRQVWDIDNATFQGSRDDSFTGHGTQKPIECMSRPIQNNSKPGDYVYEPFSGSGTTIIACEMTTRYCLAIELSPEYVDVAIQRWQEFAKAEATMIGDGRTFAEVAKARSKKGASRAKKGASAA
ncbi:MAG: site-specific DNA-methyltransferase [Patescibacteria group bacterium]|nr:site-specific DNA-methyltransferase [Patescibacteria group bacterium]